MKTEFYTQLYKRDLKRVTEELEKYPDDNSLWEVLPGTTNSGGNLLQHLIGNLKTFVGNPFGHINYERNRDAEFNARLFTKEELIVEFNQLSETIGDAISSLTSEQLDEDYPAAIKVVNEEQTVEYVLIHLFAHFSYHTGQINYHRRYITAKKVSV
ncbi:DinB family protein [Pedobacter sp. NJ-S-72]